MKAVVVALLVFSSVCLVWTSARTADTKRPNGEGTQLSGSESQPDGYVPGELIVKFRDATSEATIASAHRAAEVRTLKTFSAGASRLHHLKLNSGVGVEEAVRHYQQNPAVEYVEPNYLYQLTAIPNDSQFSTLWGLQNTGQTVNGTVGIAGVDINAPQAWDVTTGSPSVIIGVVDTGIAYDHPDLASNIWTNQGEIPNDGIDNDGNGYVDDVNGYDFFNDDADPMDTKEPTFRFEANGGHGTHVAGTIAAIGNNNLGITGVMHTAKLMALKVAPVTGGIPLTAIVLAENYASAHGARALNESFSRRGGACSQTEYDSLSALNAARVMILVAAGNNTSNNDLTPHYPAQYSVATACGPALPNVIAVSSIDQNGNLAATSNYGATSVQIAAPGVNIFSTRPTSNVTTVLSHNYDTNPGTLGYAFSGTNNSWGFTNQNSFSFPNSLTDSPSGNYLGNTDSFAVGPIFSTVGQRGCRLVGTVRFDIQMGADQVLVDVSANGGTTWTTNMNSFDGLISFFAPFVLSDLRDRNANNRFRFHFVSDNDGIVGDGVYVDDVGVNCTAGAPLGTTDYEFRSGTSMAVPHVTGVVGLVVAANPNLNVAGIRDAILNTGVSVLALNGRVSTGRRLNAFNAVRSAMDTTPPTAPSRPTASAPSGTQITLSWPAATDNVDVTGYQVERCQGVGCTNFALIASPTTTSYMDTNLTPGASYSYRVRAQDAMGNVSTYSPITTTATPGVPGAIAFDSVSNSPVNTTAPTVSWTASVGSAANRLGLVCVQARGTVQANVVVSSVSIGGLAATKIRSDERNTGTDYIRTEQWYVVNPGTGSRTITINWAGRPSNYGVGTFLGLSGVDPVAPIDAAGGGTGFGTTASASVTTVADKAWIADCAMTKQNLGFTMGAGQTSRTNRLITGLLDAMAVSTVNGKTPAGTETMDWTTSIADNFAISAVSLKPAVVTPVGSP